MPYTRRIPFISSGALTYAQQVLADNPTLYYKFNEPSGTTITDYGSAGKNATLVNTPTLGVVGAVTGDTACLFASASSQHATVANAAQNFQTGDTFSIETFAKKTSTGADMYIAAVDINSGDLACHFDSANAFLCTVRVVADLSSSSADTDTTNWVHWVFTKTGATMFVYRNGVDVTVAGTNATVSAHASATFYIGQLGNGSGYLNGSLAHLAVYSTALSQARVQAHYNAR